MAIGDPSPLELKLLDNILNWEKGIDNQNLLFLEDSDLEEPMKTQAPMCPIHPDQPQIACSPDSKRAGQHLGACKVCMAERKTKFVKDRMTPAVARDLEKLANPPGDIECKAMTQNPNQEVVQTNTLTLDFTDYPEIMEQIVSRARDDMRSPEMQAMWVLKGSLQGQPNG